MELNQDLSTKDSILVGLEEVFENPFFSKLRLALAKSSERERLYEILGAVSTLDPRGSQFIIKMREALDRPTDKEFWVWFLRAFRELDRDHKGIDELRGALTKDRAFDFNLGLLRFLEHPNTEHVKLIAAARRALEHLDSQYCVEALRIFDLFELPSMVVIKRIREDMESSDKDNTLQNLLKAFEDLHGWNWIHQLRNTLKKYPEDFRIECLSRSQIRSKKWAIEKMRDIFGPRLGFVHVLCGWYGILGTLMHLSGKFETLKVRSFDIDPTCEKIADELNRPWLADDWKFKAFTADVMSLDYGNEEENGIYVSHKGKSFREPTALIVNTSCEHMDRFDDWYQMIPKGSAMVLQSNDAFHEQEHINCVQSLADFKRQAPLSQVLFEGILPLESFNRFMLIGRK